SLPYLYISIQMLGHINSYRDGQECILVFSRGAEVPTRRLFQHCSLFTSERLAPINYSLSS
ncbi:MULTISPECIES: hypothetical protein, partial [Limnospira]|uniref:hypothetical protein n=1 Tax=Limnospira TaxID=2596745 RepID=UPI0028E0B5D9|nr:hypothetical protein [Limnospira sp. PMC 289.06]MDT9298406.1 hypothetical protein [Arthrospira platensis PCC 7345]